MAWAKYGQCLLHNGKVAEVETEERALTTFEMNIFHASFAWTKLVVNPHDDEVKAHRCQTNYWQEKQKSKLSNWSEQRRQIARNGGKVQVPVAAQVVLSCNDFSRPNVDTGYHEIHGLDVKHCEADQRTSALPSTAHTQNIDNQV